MRRTIRITLVALALATLTSCLGGRSIKYYTVELPPGRETVTSTYPVTLLIGHIGGPGILEDQPIVYRSGPNEIGTYQYHQWVEPPVQMLKISLVRRLRASGRYQSVAQLGSSARGEFVLQGRLYSFEEVDRGGAISALVSMEFELIDRATRKPVWNHFYSRTDPVKGKDISAVVAALDNNLQRGLVEVQSGLDTYFASHPPGKP